MPRPKIVHDRPKRAVLVEKIKSASLSEAARYFCGSRSHIKVIREWCLEYNISIPAPRIRRSAFAMPKPTRDKLEHVLQTRETMREVAAYFTVTSATIYAWMRYFKLKR